MPFINSKISTPVTAEQENKIKSRLGKAIHRLYFRGSSSEPMAMVEVSVYGSENPSAFEKLTAQICDIFNDVLGIAPDHIYVKYQAVSNWGWNGSNF